MAKALARGAIGATRVLLSAVRASRSRARNATAGAFDGKAQF
ncbi:unnamed protein product [Mycetohabitans rhizoxinica HKI 454]|uniref:Uncharacterized protein n=1 Tax=Mycetohabitans rhizoxinica (strain DSM 19002 / CIP 109453 / HKI 454) TaxID=882378 RepID=E5ASX7_MYCRK|nr:unnamed protein product [Mycetohabitans rhizoxinica HKI 454]